MVAASLREDNGPTTITVWRNEVKKSYIWLCKAHLILLGSPIAQAEQYPGEPNPIEHKDCLALHRRMCYIPICCFDCASDSRPFSLEATLAAFIFERNPNTYRRHDHYHRHSFYTYYHRHSLHAYCHDDHYSYCYPHYPYFRSQISCTEHILRGNWQDSKPSHFTPLFC